MKKMNADFYQYTTQMKAYLDAQSKRIASLEAELTTLKETLKKVPTEPSVTIEKIEYKFDQLKIERLDGTLNIGLNPGHLAELEEFSVNGQQAAYPVPFPKQLRDQLTRQIEQEITAYVEKELPTIISGIEGEFNIQSQGEYLEFIRQDLFKQLHERIHHYLNQFPYNEQNERNNDYKERVVEQIKTDIIQAVRSFFQNVQNGMKGM